MSRETGMALAVSVVLHAMFLLAWPAPQSPGQRGSAPRVMVLGLVQSAAAMEHAPQTAHGAEAAVPEPRPLPAPEPLEEIQASPAPVEEAPQREPKPPLERTAVQRPQRAAPEPAPPLPETQMPSPEPLEPQSRGEEPARPAAADVDGEPCRDALPARAEGRRGPTGAARPARAARRSSLPSAGLQPDPGARRVRSGQIADARSAYLARIQERIHASKYYPPRARRRFWQGTVELRFVVRRDGRVEEVLVSRSSGYRDLDDGAVRTLERAAPFEPIPAELPEGRLRISLPIVYRVR